MPPGVRRFALTVHVVCSVGWTGAVGTFLVVAVAGRSAEDAELIRAAHLALEWIGRFVLVPLALGSLVTGVVQALGTRWGLFRHYWVVFKLLINVFATFVLLLYIQTLDVVAAVAAKPMWSADDLALLRSPSPILHASVALILLLVATVLAIYKPRGETPFRARRDRAASARS